MSVAKNAAAVAALDAFVQQPILRGGRRRADVRLDDAADIAVGDDTSRGAEIVLTLPRGEP